MNPLNSLRFTFHQKNWARCLLFNLANDCLLNWANSQKWQLFSLKLLFWVKIGVILWICLALQVVISFSAWEKSCDSTHRIFILEHKMRSIDSRYLFWLGPNYIFKLSIFGWQLSKLFFDWEFRINEISCEKVSFILLRWKGEDSHGWVCFLSADLVKVTTVATL